MVANIEVYTGPMMSGKSQALINAAECLSQNGLRVASFQSDKNSRDNMISSRNGLSLPSGKISSLTELADDDYFDAYIIDEFQFFDDPEREVSYAERLASSLGKTVVIGTLDYDYKGDEWAAYSALKNAEVDGNPINIFSLIARCDESFCENGAAYTALLNDNVQVFEGSQIIVDGPQVSYSPRCSDHFDALHAKPQLTD